MAQASPSQRGLIAPRPASSTGVHSRNNNNFTPSFGSLGRPTGAFSNGRRYPAPDLFAEPRASPRGPAVMETSVSVHSNDMDVEFRTPFSHTEPKSVQGTPRSLSGSTTLWETEPKLEAGAIAAEPDRASQEYVLPSSLPRPAIRQSLPRPLPSSGHNFTFPDEPSPGRRQYHDNSDSVESSSVKAPPIPRPPTLSTRSSGSVRSAGGVDTDHTTTPGSVDSPDITSMLDGVLEDLKKLASRKTYNRPTAAQPATRLESDGNPTDPSWMAPRERDQYRGWEATDFEERDRSVDDSSSTLPRGRLFREHNSSSPSIPSPCPPHSSSSPLHTAQPSDFPSTPKRSSLPGAPSPQYASSNAYSPAPASVVLVPERHPALGAHLLARTMAPLAIAGDPPRKSSSQPPPRPSPGRHLISPPPPQHHHHHHHHHHRDHHRTSVTPPVDSMPDRYQGAESPFRVGPKRVDISSLQLELEQGLARHEAVTGGSLNLSSFHRAGSSDGDQLHDRRWAPLSLKLIFGIKKHDDLFFRPMSPYISNSASKSTVLERVEPLAPDSPSRSKSWGPQASNRWSEGQSHPRVGSLPPVSAESKDAWHDQGLFTSMPRSAGAQHGYGNASPAPSNASQYPFPTVDVGAHGRSGSASGYSVPTSPGGWNGKTTGSMDGGWGSGIADFQMASPSVQGGRPPLSTPDTLVGRQGLEQGHRAAESRRSIANVPSVPKASKPAKKAPKPPGTANPKSQPGRTGRRKGWMSRDRERSREQPRLPENQENWQLERSFDSPRPSEVDPEMEVEVGRRSQSKEEKRMSKAEKRASKEARRVSKDRRSSSREDKRIPDSRTRSNSHDGRVSQDVTHDLPWMEEGGEDKFGTQSPRKTGERRNAHKPSSSDPTMETTSPRERRVKQKQQRGESYHSRKRSSSPALVPQHSHYSQSSRSPSPRRGHVTSSSHSRSPSSHRARESRDDANARWWSQSPDGSRRQALSVRSAPASATFPKSPAVSTATSETWDSRISLRSAPVSLYDDYSTPWSPAPSGVRTDSSFGFSGSSTLGRSPGGSQAGQSPLYPPSFLAAQKARWPISNPVYLASGPPPIDVSATIPVQRQDDVKSVESGSLSGSATGSGFLSRGKFNPFKNLLRRLSSTRNSDGTWVGDPVVVDPAAAQSNAVPVPTFSGHYYESSGAVSPSVARSERSDVKGIVRRVSGFFG
ncbi:hypothetical protein M427DRAFT_192570 [Gonapodya prolifera JEL478]|uniref:Uncharacterized protein n=1 Tax=Gonapodya prolifera (strain JEL478) TaxID=1344416 RepID=A0A139A010_GONPJ|nr:hypothetical protein M427DRAFT_192570 [Gonapodya prolifera JEL478]|eukprot:KXS10117.1 hypothetical protein M427DRAFT_192570 [Gonapodya prolifera JEL478]